MFEVPKQNGKYETGQVSAGLRHLSFSLRALLLKGSDLVTGMKVTVFCLGVWCQTRIKFFFFVFLFKTGFLFSWI